MKKRRKVFAILLSTFSFIICVCFSGCELWDSMWRKLVPPSYLPITTYYGVVQTIEESEGKFVYIDGVGMCEIPRYEKETLTVKEGDLLVMEFYTDQVMMLECYPGRLVQAADYMAVVDFSFSLIWGLYGISSYDSETGRLIKTKDAPNVEDFITTYFLTPQEKLTAFKTLMDLEMTSYPDEYNPTQGIGSYPYETLILSAKIDRVEKTVTASQVALSEATSKKGQRFMDACRTISDILKNTDEWKSLPDYPYLYY